MLHPITRHVHKDDRSDRIRFRTKNSIEPIFVPSPTTLKASTGKNVEEKFCFRYHDDLVSTTLEGACASSLILFG